MLLHANAKLGLAGRSRWFARSRAAVAEGGRGRFSVSPATAHRWWHRWLEASEEARRTLSCLLDRSSRPHRSPRQLAPELAGARSASAAARPAGVRGWSPARPASPTRPSGRCSGAPGISRPPRPPKEPANSYEWPCPGDLLHMDTSRYARFLRPGHARHRRPLAALTQLDAPRDAGRLRLRARDRRRPLAARLRRAPRRRDAPRP